MFTIRLLEKFFRSSYDRICIALRVTITSCDYSLVTFFGKALKLEPPVDHNYFPVKSLYVVRF